MFLSLFLTLAYGWSFYPNGLSSPVNLKKLEWRSNINSISVDLHLHEGAYCGERFSIPVKFVHVRIWHKEASNILGAFRWTHMLFRDQSGIGNYKFYVHEFEDMLFEARDRNSNQRSLSDCVGAQCWVGLHRCIQHRGQRIDDGLRPTGDITFTAQKLPDHIKIIYSSGTGHSIQGEIPFSCSPDFAHIGLNKTVFIDNPTVRSYGNLVVSPLYRDGSAVAERSLRESEDRRYKKGDQPRWVRHRYSQSAAWCFWDSKNNTVCDLGGEDIDVSLDGKEWFHLLGLRCADGLPNWFERPAIIAP